jgi:hypothetical protein
VHVTHTLHAVPDLRIAAGRLRDGFYHMLHRDRRFEALFPGTTGMVLTASGFEFVISVENRRSEYKL